MAPHLSARPVRNIDGKIVRMHGKPIRFWYTPEQVLQVAMLHGVETLEAKLGRKAKDAIVQARLLSALRLTRKWETQIRRKWGVKRPAKRRP
jgi:hypothetical protein